MMGKTERVPPRGAGITLSLRRLHTAHRRRQDPEGANGAHRTRHGVSEGEGRCRMEEKALLVAQDTHSGLPQPVRAAWESTFDDELIFLYHTDIELRFIRGAAALAGNA